MGVGSWGIITPRVTLLNTNTYKYKPSKSTYKPSEPIKENREKPISYSTKPILGIPILEYVPYKEDKVAKVINEFIKKKKNR